MTQFVSMLSGKLFKDKLIKMEGKTMRDKPMTTTKQLMNWQPRILALKIDLMERISCRRSQSRKNYSKLLRTRPYLVSQLISERKSRRAKKRIVSSTQFKICSFKAWIKTNLTLKWTITQKILRQNRPRLNSKRLKRSWYSWSQWSLLHPLQRFLSRFR